MSGATGDVQRCVVLQRGDALLRVPRQKGLGWLATYRGTPFTYVLGCAQRADTSEEELHGAGLRNVDGLYNKPRREFLTTVSIDTVGDVFRTCEEMGWDADDVLLGVDMFACDMQSVQWNLDRRAWIHDVDDMEPEELQRLAGIADLAARRSEPVDQTRQCGAELDMGTVPKHMIPLARRTAALQFEAGLLR